VGSQPLINVVVMCLFWARRSPHRELTASRTHRIENIVELRVIAIAANDDPMIDR
jgi:hypothetical protein